MKKILLLTSIVLFLAPYKSKSDNTAADSAGKAGSAKTGPRLSKADTDIQITLNGIDKPRADAMKTYFNTNKYLDEKPIRKSVWFDKVSFHKMVALLNKERGPESVSGVDSKGQTDGIRIYFVSDTIIKGHLNNSIIIVSTKNCGRDNTVHSGAVHRDYYTHSKNDPLFSNLDSIKGTVKARPWPISLSGETLYNPTISRFKKDGINSCKGEHYISRGKANKMVNQFGKCTITTISEWFDIKLLRLLDSDAVHDGIRIYFTRHPDKYQAVRDTDTHKEAFVLITTKYHFNKLTKKVFHHDYFDCAATEQYYLDEKKRLDWYKHHLLTSGDGGDDNGELCPSHCN